MPLLEKEKDMRTTRLSALALMLAVASLAIGAGAAHAGVISSVTSVGGPGGTGSGIFVPFAPNNDNVVGGNPNLIFLSESFISIAPIDAVFTLVPTTGTTEYSAQVTVNNSTGVAWTDFHFELIP